MAGQIAANPALARKISTAADSIRRSTTRAPNRCILYAAMGKELKILSLSYDPEELQRRESTLRAHGFEVKSVYSPGQARFEIEMGTCGILITCALIPDIVNRDLMDLFRRSCGAQGLIIFVASDNSASNSPYEPEADIRIPQSQDPEGIVEALLNKSLYPGRRSTNLEHQ